MEETLRRPWLVASWPGMGGVAQIAGYYLVRRLGARPTAEVDSRKFFEVRSVHVHGGIFRPASAPRTVFHAWRDPEARHDLLILTGESQPEGNIGPYSEALLDVAAKAGVERVFTFAAMATPVHPTASPRVFGVATEGPLLAELRRGGAEALGEGEISGMNGAFAAAAAARGLPAACLLGEFPFFAASLPNPKASAAVLKVFAAVRGIGLDLRELQAEGQKVEEALVRHLAELQDSARRAAGEDGADAAHEEREAEASAEEGNRTSGEPANETPSARVAPRPALSGGAELRIEALFAQAAADRTKALELKAELDRLGVFKRYEDRFLDLFKKAG